MLNKKRSLKIIFSSFFTVVISVLVIVFFAHAGTLTPPGSAASNGIPTSTSYTLANIYTRLTTNDTATEAGHVFSPAASPAGTFYTLKQIYDAIPTILTDQVLSGTSYLGKAGAYAITNLTAANVKNGITYGTSSTGTLLPNGGTATTTDVLSGKTYFGASQNNWTLRTGTMTNKVGSATVLTPSTIDQAVPQGYYGGAVGDGKVSGDSNLTAGNIRKSTAIFGVTGTLYGDTDATKVCDNATAAGSLQITASTVSVGNSYCGISGTLLKNEYNGSAGTSVQDFAFYTLVTSTPGFLGGVEDNSPLPVGSYTGAGWSSLCDIGNHYCGAGDSAISAYRKDNNTNLVWSSTLDSGNNHTWFWANNCYEPGDPQNLGDCASNGDDACRCVKKSSSPVGCEALDDGLWRMPTQKEMMQAYIDGSSANLNLQDAYWTATTNGGNTLFAWRIDIGDGLSTSGVKIDGSSYKVRCVRSAQ
jgi:hypothetical protein